MTVERSGPDTCLITCYEADGSIRCQREIACDGATNSFALTEQERPGHWRWAIISERGVILRAGWESTQVAAKEFANAALLERSKAPGPQLA